VRFVWIMGADNLAQMERWHRWREIFGLFPIAVVDRPGWRLKALSSKAARAYAGRRLPESDARMLAHTPPPAWVFLTGPLSQVSSTALRAKAKATAKGRNEVVAKRAQAPAELPWRRPKAALPAPGARPPRNPSGCRKQKPPRGLETGGGERLSFPCGPRIRVGARQPAGLSVRSARGRARSMG
jgi:hypothetical protein